MKGVKMSIFDLPILEMSKPDLSLYQACCEECGWYGLEMECDSYQDQESWEIPRLYTVWTCPHCDSDQVDVWESDYDALDADSV